MSPSFRAGTLEFAREDQLLRVTFVTPGQIGAGSGTADVDRPVRLDPWSGLPLIPDSAIKGVLAGVQGNVCQDLATPGSFNDRAETFGHPDGVNPTGQFINGKSSKIVFGDAEILCFPLALRDGRTAYVVPAANFSWMAGKVGVEPPAPMPDSGWAGEIRADLLPVTAASVRYALPYALLARLAGWDDRPRLVIAGEVIARRLWLHAVEERSMTAIEAGTKRARAQSLRTVELIPAGTVFLSLVTNTAATPLKVPTGTHVQLGAWESIGCGFVRLAVVGKDGESLSESLARQESTYRSPEHKVMARIHGAVRSLVQGEGGASRPRPEAARVRSLALDLGPQLRILGTGQTLAFLAAKAGLLRRHDAKGPGVDALAARFVLRTILDVPTESGGYVESRRSPGPGVSGGRAGDKRDTERPASEVPDLLDRTIAAIQTDAPLLSDTARWLRRYCESILPEGARR